MIVFIDTNLILDVMLRNSDFFNESNAVLDTAILPQTNNRCAPASIFCKICKNFHENLQKKSKRNRYTL